MKRTGPAEDATSFIRGHGPDRSDGIGALADGGTADATMAVPVDSRARIVRLAERDTFRDGLRARRAALPPAERAAAADALARHLDDAPGYPASHRVAGYWAHAGELPLSTAASRVGARGNEWFLPVLVGRTLHFAEWHTGAEFATNRFGIPEPVGTGTVDPPALDVVLVPLVAFDRSGGRIGSGGGWYDRSFAFLATAPRPLRPLLIGIGYAFQEVAKIETAAWDVGLDFVATERELIACRTGR